MLQVHQSLWKEKESMHVALWPRICSEKKGQMQLGLQERILKTSVTSLKFCYSANSVDGLNSYQVLVLSQ